MAAARVQQALPPREQAYLERSFEASLPPVLLVTGSVYAVFSGAIFLGSRHPDWATPFWAATVAIGLILAGTGWMVQRRGLPTAALATLAGGLGILLLAHDLTLIVLADDPDQSAYLFMLLAAAGYVLLVRPALLAVHVAGLAGWTAAALFLHVPLTGPDTAIVVLGVAVGWAANGLRVRHLRLRARALAATEGSLAASEARFRSLAETAQDAILLLDEEGRFTYLNPAGLRLFGLRDGDVAGRLLSQHLADGTPGLAALVGTTEVEAHRRDGTPFAAELALARAERDGALGYTGVLRDVTERKRAARATQEAAARESEVDHLRSMNEFKTRFLNMAAHELNTPLTPLRLQLHLLKSEQMGPLSAKQVKAVALLDRNVTRLSGLVGELLEVARLQSGRLRLQLQPVALDELVDEVIESFGEAARRVGIVLTYAGDHSLTVQADRNRTTQVLFNLVSNAVKFTPAGGHVTVEARDTGPHVEVTVADTGLGMSREQQARLFQPFSQVHDPMAITASGTGLGLYICKGLVEAQGGAIHVASAGPGQGSTFTFTLPSAHAQPARPAPGRAADEDPIVRRLRELI